ncbi:hypothetical protein ACGFNU_08235 [Spirillospora sp. NPDC048911]|uniref:hypothetical protein n=1 Tax=Spirillospora sp. NPDC048911 TaxID=3364527 RepID=UPI0037193C56
MRGDPGTLYDAHAARLYAYCWSLVGDDAAAAVTDTFAATVQHPPRGDGVLWMYALARSTCVERGALDRGFALASAASAADPVLRAAGSLRADHREMLLLHDGEWLEIDDIARVLGIAPDTARQLLNVARQRFERAVLDVLMRETGPQSLEIIAAFEKGTLPRLLARRAPDQPPAWLREHVLTAFEGELTGPLPGIATSNPVVVIGSEAASKGRTRRRAKSITAITGVAASAAAAAGLLVSWPAAGDGASSLVPTEGSGNTDSTSSLPATHPNQTGTSSPSSTGTPRDTGGGVSGAPDQGAAPLPSAGGGGGTPSQPVPTSEPGTTPPPDEGKPKPPEDSPSPPEATPTPPPEETPTEPAPTPTPPTEEPGTPDPAPTEPTDNPPTPPTQEPSPSPSNNPAPTPDQG